MPTLVNLDGYRIMIFTNDHEPPHVHVFKAECRAIVLLNCPTGPPTLRESEGFNKRELNKIYRIVSSKIKLLCLKWEEIHV